MLNIFPDLLTYHLLSPFLLRLIAGLIFIDLGILAWKTERSRWIASLETLRIPKPNLGVKVLGLIELVGGIMLVLGAYTQLVALVLAILTLAESYVEYKEPNILKRSLPFYSMLFVITLSLLFTGAGFLSLDLPL